MNKKIIIIGLILLLLIVVLSGCVNTYNNENNESSDNLYQEKKQIEKPIFNVTDEYKSSCQLINFSDLYSEPENYTGKNVTCRGRIEDIRYDEGYTLYEISDEEFLSFWDLTYDYIMVATDEYRDMQKDDLIQVWGVAQGSYTPKYSIFYYKYIWSFFIEKLYEEPNLSEYVLQEFYEQIDWKNPSYAEMVNFVRTDNTDKYSYSTDPDNYFVCYDFCENMILNARERGLVIGDVTIYPPENDSVGITEVHTLVCFNTSNNGLCFVEPQTDEIFTKDEMDNMKSDGWYGNIEFDHYSYHFPADIVEDTYSYEWDYLQGVWIFNYDNQSYTISPIIED